MSSTSGDTGKYQGWTNHATWAMALHLSNTESLERACRALVEERGSVQEGAEAIRELIEESLEGHYLVDPDKSPRRPWESSPLYLLFSDLLGYALGSVNWYEVADSFKPDSWGDADTAPQEQEEEE